SLVNVTEKLAAKSLLASFLTGHDSVRSRDDVDAKSTEHFRDLSARHIHAAAWPADALNVRYDPFTFRTVLQKYSQVAAASFFGCLEMRNVTFLFQDPRNLAFEPRSRHVDFRVLGLNGVPDSGQHICNRIGHGSSRCVSLPARLDDSG